MKISPAIPELPVRDVVAAQNYFRDRFGFRIEWHHAEGRLGAVSHGDCAIFFRETREQIHPGTFWIFAHDVDATFADLQARGADITDPVANKPWGMRQFSARDLNGNIFHFHHDIASPA